jgi:hypothetical protein
MSKRGENFNYLPVLLRRKQNAGRKEIRKSEKEKDNKDGRNKMDGYTLEIRKIIRDKQG